MGKNKKRNKNNTEDPHDHKEPLLQNGELTAKFKQCLVQIFSRFDADGDKVLCEAELQSFSRSANKDGHEFAAEELLDMKSMFEWQNDAPCGGGLTLRGFVQMYTAQTRTSEKETWSDLDRLGFDGSLVWAPSNIRLEKDHTQGDCQYSTDAPLESKKKVLEEQLREFAVSDALTLALPASLMPSERQHVHTVATSMGLQSQSFGLGAKRAIHVFKVPDDRQTTPKGVKLEDTDDGFTCVDRKGGNLVFTGVELDVDSSHRLIDTFQEHIDKDWDVFAHHMTICLGSLSDARANKHCTVSADAQERIRALKFGQAIVLRVVSIGRAHGVMAVGVVGCPTTNQTPHITLACAPGHKPVESNEIAEWAALPNAKVMNVTGIVRGFKQGDMGKIAAAAASHAGKPTVNDAACERRGELLLQLRQKENQILALREKNMSRLQKCCEEKLELALQQRERELESLSGVDSEDDDA